MAVAIWVFVTATKAGAQKVLCERKDRFSFNVTKVESLLDVQLHWMDELFNCCMNAQQYFMKVNPLYDVQTSLKKSK